MKLKVVTVELTEQEIWDATCVALFIMSGIVGFILGVVFF